MSQSSVTLLDSPSIRSWSKVRPAGNLAWLAIDYLTAALVIAGALYFHFSYEKWGLHFLWHVPVWGAAVILIGIVQHRIGLMGHEASHNLLVPNRRWNDILAEILCFFPVFGSLIQYRAKHLPHHLYPNDAERDPNLGNGKAERLYAKFPMPKLSFIYQYYVKFFWPPFVLANLLDLIDVIMIGSGMSPVPVRDRRPDEPGKGTSKFLRIKGTVLGLIYLAMLIVVLRASMHLGWSMWAAVGVLYAIAVVVWAILPESAFFRAARLNFTVKASALLRLTWYTLLFSGLGAIALKTGWDPTLAFLVLWILPLIYVFPYLMLLREVCQHANLGVDQLDNSRIIHADPFTRWAVFGYGNDLHLVHHLYPNVPHYHLLGTHDQLTEVSQDYRDEVEVTRGMISPPGGSDQASLLDALALEKKRSDPED